jgi:hypothetical protein
LDLERDATKPKRQGVGVTAGETAQRELMKITQKSFLADVGKHQMDVLLDDGFHRHLHFRAPETNNQYFELVTWPGCLCITGDMGTFVFRRLQDMFEFFRGHRINEAHWAEKLEAVDRGSGAEKFDAETYIQRITERVTDSLDEDYDRKEGILAALKEALQLDEEHELYAAVYAFEHDSYSILDAWEVSGKVFTGRYQWALHAIVWGIAQYDARKI